MASAFGHAALAYSLARSVCPEHGQTRFWVSALACSILPDVDTAGFGYGIPYGSFLGHRGFTHSLLFALLVGIFTVRILFPELKRFSKHWFGLVLFFFVVTASHGFLDAMTGGGLGVAFFSPFDLRRYFLPWRPIAVSPINFLEFFNPESSAVLKSEFVWIFLPSLALFLVSKALRFLKSAIRNPKSAIP